jgi:hypothetical protein
VLVGVGADVLVAVGGAGVDEGLGATVGVVIAAGPQATRVKSRNRDVSFFMVAPQFVYQMSSDYFDGIQNVSYP